MRNIAFFVKTFEGGGAQRVFSTLAREFVCQNHRVHIVTMFYAASYSLPEGTDVFNMSIDRSNLSISHNMNKILAAAQFLEQRQIDTVVIGSTSAPLYKYAIEMQKVFDFRIVAQMTNDPNCSPRVKELRDERDSVFDYLYTVRSGFVFQTTYERDYFGEAIARRSVIINNPIMDFDCKPHKGSRRKVITTAGRLDEQKNFSLLLKAFSIFCTQRDDYRLEIYGRGHMEEQLKKESALLGVKNKVDFCGFDLNWHAKLVDSAMFVQSSDYEGVSNVILEALCLGVPTVSTDCPAYGARMFAQTGESILLVPVGNAEELALAMLKLANDETLSKKFSEESVKIQHQLKVENIVKEYLSYFDRLDEEDMMG